MAFERALVEGEMDTFQFVLAERLGKTLTELAAMPRREYLAWQAYYTYRAAVVDLEKKRAGG